VHLVPLPQAAQDADRVLDPRLVDDDRLEAPLEGGVLFDVLPVLVEGRRADAVKLAAREHRLQQVRSVHRAFGGTGTHDGVKLVDEEDDLAVRVGDLLEDGLEALLELAAVLRAGDERAHVERHDSPVLQAFRHIAAHDALREPFGDRRLADARVSDEDRVVLRPPGEDLDDAADLLVSADDRVEQATARRIGQVATVLLERLVGCFRILVCHAVGSSDGLQCFDDRPRRDAGGSQDPLGGAARGILERGEQQVLGGDVVVVHPLGDRMCV
jgi:hypothetical protein